MRNYLLNKTLTLLLVLQIILVGWASRHPKFVEKYYSNGIYPEISGFLRRMLGWIPFSVGDIFYFILFLLLLRWLWYVYETRFTPILEHLWAIGGVSSVIFLVFHLFWGLNYHRLPLQERLGIENLKYDTLLLQKTTEKHLLKINQIHRQLVTDDSIPVIIPYSRTKIYHISADLYKNFQIKQQDFSFRIRSLKTSLVSVPLSYMGFSGYLNPFTGESQVNKKIPNTTLPITATHELAHQLGYASETEANYIGYKVCISQPDLYFQYSGEYLAVRYLIYEVKRYNPELAEQYYKKLNIGVQRNIENNQDVWDSYDTPLKPFFQKLYDKYLKANQQYHGIKSYNAMVAFIMAENN